MRKAVLFFLITFVLSGAARSCTMCGVVEGQRSKIFIFISNCPSTTFLEEHSSFRSGRRIIAFSLNLKHYGVQFSS